MTPTYDPTEHEDAREERAKELARSRARLDDLRGLARKNRLDAEQGKEADRLHARIQDLEAREAPTDADEPR